MVDKMDKQFSEESCYWMIKGKCQILLTFQYFVKINQLQEEFFLKNKNSQQD